MHRLILSVSSYIGILFIGNGTNLLFDPETRLQRSTAIPGESALTRIIAISKDMFKHEGFRAFYQGITPRIMRVAPGQV